MQSTTRDFLKVIYDRQCGVIVMLSDLVEDGKVKSSRLAVLLSMHVIFFTCRRYVTSTGPSVALRPMESLL